VLKHRLFRIYKYIGFGTRKHKTRDILFLQSIRDVNYVEALTVHVPKPDKETELFVVKENLKILLTKYKFLYINYFIQKVITSVHIIEKEYLTLWGYFTKVRAHKRLWFALSCGSSIDYGLDEKGIDVQFPR